MAIPEEGLQMAQVSRSSHPAKVQATKVDSCTNRWHIDGRSIFVPAAFRTLSSGMKGEGDTEAGCLFTGIQAHEGPCGRYCSSFAFRLQLYRWRARTAVTLYASQGVVRCILSGIGRFWQ